MSDSKELTKLNFALKQWIIRELNLGADEYVIKLAMRNIVRDALDEYGIKFQCIECTNEFKVGK